MNKRNHYGTYIYIGSSKMVRTQIIQGSGGQRMSSKKRFKQIVKQTVLDPFGTKRRDEKRRANNLKTISSIYRCEVYGYIASLEKSDICNKRNRISS